MTLSIGSATKLLFIGDSITHADLASDPERLGYGYVRLLRDVLAARLQPNPGPIVVNGGLNGETVVTLAARWQRDVLDAAPHVLSISIGINDVWHGLMPGRTGTDIDTFVAAYHDILSRLRHALPDTALVLCEPSVLWFAELPNANDLLDPYVAAVHRLAGAFGAIAVVRLHEAFERARAARSDVALTLDGVHPTVAGHTLIAQTWLGAVGLL